MFTKFQIAIQYYPEHIENPNAAYKKLNRAINRCKGLRKLLDESGYNNRQRDFTPLQASLIYENLGEPVKKKRK